VTRYDDELAHSIVAGQSRSNPLGEAERSTVMAIKAIGQVQQITDRVVCSCEPLTEPFGSTKGFDAATHISQFPQFSTGEGV
jgi:hypothetical protein